MYTFACKLYPGLYKQIYVPLAEGDASNQMYSMGGLGGMGGAQELIWPVLAHNEHIIKQSIIISKEI